MRRFYFLIACCLLNLGAGPTRRFIVGRLELKGDHLELCVFKKSSAEKTFVIRADVTKPTMVDYLLRWRRFLGRQFRVSGVVGDGFVLTNPSLLEPLVPDRRLPNDGDHL